jgi:WLM domain
MSIIDIIATIVIIILLLVALYYIYDWVFGNSQLKCIVSNVNGETYCIRERSKAKEKEVVDLLANTVERAKKLVDHMMEKYPENDYCQRLKKNFNPEAIKENLPNSTLTSYTENKGQSISLCVNSNKQNKNELIDQNTLMFVLIHELAHCSTTSVGHQTDFWDFFKFLLKEAVSIGIYNPENYKQSPKPYCGIQLTDSPYYDLKNEPPIQTV